MAVQPLHIDTYNTLIPDVSTANSFGQFAAASGGTIEWVAIVLAGTIATAPAVVTIFKNGVTTEQTLSLTHTSSVKGAKFTWTGAISVAEGDLIEFRSSGASTNAESAAVTVRVRKLTS